MNNSAVLERVAAESAVTTQTRPSVTQAQEHSPSAAFPKNVKNTNSRRLNDGSINVSDEPAAELDSEQALNDLQLDLPTVVLRKPRKHAAVSATSPVTTRRPLRRRRTYSMSRRQR